MKGKQNPDTTVSSSQGPATKRKKKKKENKKKKSINHTKKQENVTYKPGEKQTTETDSEMMELPENNIKVIIPIFKCLKENMVMRKKVPKDKYMFNNFQK